MAAQPSDSCPAQGQESTAESTVDTANTEVIPRGDGQESRTLSANTFADLSDFHRTLKTLATLATKPDSSSTPFSVDGPSGRLVLFEGSQVVCDGGQVASLYSQRPADGGSGDGGEGGDGGAGANQVTGTVIKDGRVVREHMQSGPDMVVAYDEQGNAHRYPDEKITGLPVDFSSIPDWRLKQMNETAYKLLEKYMIGSTPIGGPDGMISFHDVASIMKDITKMDDLTEVEKCRLWSEVRNVMHERNVPVLDADEQSEKIDSWKGSGDPWHALIVLNDGYHGNTLINMTPEEASQVIRDHEEGSETQNMGWFDALKWKTAKLVLGTNTGDIEASEAQLRALRELRSQGTFAAYAAEWERQFVRTDRDQWGFPLK